MITRGLSLIVTDTSLDSESKGERQMSTKEARATIRQMLADWNALPESQKADALYQANIAANERVAREIQARKEQRKGRGQ